MNEKSIDTILYKQWREEIKGQDEVHTSDAASEFLLKCRTKALKLNDRKRFTSENTECWLCIDKNSNLSHILWCSDFATEKEKLKTITTLPGKNRGDNQKAVP